MNARTKKFVGLLVLIPALILYFGIVVTIAERLPSSWLFKLVYFVITGLAWALPVIPFIRWMEKDPAPGERRKDNNKG